MIRSPYLLGVGGWVSLLSFCATIVYFAQANIVAATVHGAGAQTRIFATIDLAVGLLSAILGALLLCTALVDLQAQSSQDRNPASAAMIARGKAMAEAADCSSCHTAHGSTNPRLLNVSLVNMLCLQCHTFPTQGPIGPVHNQSAKYQACTMCHQAIHGSNFSNVFFK